MSFTLKTLIDHFTLLSNDDHELGKIVDFYIDERSFSVRYLVIDTLPWLPLSTKVLISPVSFTHFDLDNKLVCLDLSKQQIKDCPSKETDEPVSKEFESQLFKYFGYGYYWTGAGLWGDFNHPNALQALFEEQDFNGEKGDNPLRSFKELSQYQIQTNDGKHGRLVDFVLNQRAWTLPSAILGKFEQLSDDDKLICKIAMLNDISWQDHSIAFDGDLNQLLQLPKFEKRDFDTFS